jgi:hypothetical protein
MYSQMNLPLHIIMLLHIATVIYIATPDDNKTTPRIKKAASSYLDIIIEEVRSFVILFGPSIRSEWIGESWIISYLCLRYNH